MELAAKYSKWDFFCFACILCLCHLGRVYFFWLAMVEFSGFRYSLLPPSKYMFLPLPISWAIISIFVGIIGSALPVYLIIRLLLGEKYTEYQKFNLMKSSGNSLKSGYVFLGISALLCVMASFLMLDYYTVAYPDKLIVNQFWSIGEKQYLYTDIFFYP